MPRRRGGRSRKASDDGLSMGHNRVWVGVMRCILAWFRETKVDTQEFIDTYEYCELEHRTYLTMRTCTWRLRMY